MEENKSKKTLIVKVLFLVGIIILIGIFAFAVVQITPRIFSGLASVGQFLVSPFTSKSIKVSSSNLSVDSEEPFVLSWEYNNKERGYYTLSFGCVENADVSILSQGSEKALKCNTDYRLNNDKSAELVATLEKENLFVEIPFTIAFVSNESKESLATGQISIGVTNDAEDDGSVIISEPVEDDSENEDTVVPTSPRNPSRQTGYTAPTYSGLADLVIQNAYAINNDTVTFTVSNTGGQNSGPWYFEYTYPNGQRLNSPSQISLAPEQGLRFTLTLGSTKSGNVTVMVDPDHRINEKSDNNNNISISVAGNGGSSIDNDYNKNDDADLVIEEFEVGRLSGSRFVEDDEIDENDEAAIRFIVKNNGGESTGSWRYEITNLPYDSDDEYKSRSQSSLQPGQSVEIVLGFDNPDEGDYSIRVEVDSDDDVDEEKENNNTKSRKIEVRD